LIERHLVDAGRMHYKRTYEGNARSENFAQKVAASNRITSVNKDPIFRIASRIAKTKPIGKCVHGSLAAIVDQDRATAQDRFDAVVISRPRSLRSLDFR
jgi:hypothetical protein